MNFILNEFLRTQGRQPQAGYSFAEMASLCNLTEQSIRLYVKRGNLKAFKTSPRKWGKVSHAEAERFLSEFNGGE